MLVEVKLMDGSHLAEEIQDIEYAHNYIYVIIDEEKKIAFPRESVAYVVTKIGGHLDEDPSNAE